MRILVKTAQVIYSMYAILMFVAFMLIIIPFVIFFSFFGKITGGNLIYNACSIWGDFWFLFIGIRHRNIYLSPKPSPGNGIYIANHISYMDVPALVVSIREPVRVLGKIELSRIPVFGFLYRYATVMVDRSSTENRAKSVKTLKSILRRGISVVIFPEGTFNETGKPLAEFYNGAFRIALETQTPIRPVVFVDTMNRLHYRSIFTLSPGLLRAVFLDEIPVVNLTMKDLEQLKSTVFNNMEAEIVKWQNL